MEEEAGLGEKLMKTLSRGLQLKWPGGVSVGGGGVAKLLQLLCLQ